MGMNLEPVDKLAIGGDFNWSGWSNLIDLLDLLKCDTRWASHTNDGDLIPADTCRAWAAAIRKALPHLREVTMPSSRYVGGTKTSYITGRALKQTRLPDVAAVTRISPSSSRWLEEHCQFLEQCDGCYQF